VILAKSQMINFSVISWQELYHIYFWW